MTHMQSMSLMVQLSSAVRTVGSGTKVAAELMKNMAAMSAKDNVNQSIQQFGKEAMELKMNMEMIFSNMDGAMGDLSAEDDEDALQIENEISLELSAQAQQGGAHVPSGLLHGGAAGSALGGAAGSADAAPLAAGPAGGGSGPFAPPPPHFPPLPPGGGGGGGGDGGGGGGGGGPPQAFNGPAMADELAKRMAALGVNKL